MVSNTQKRILWLLCATVLSGQPAFAEEAAKEQAAASAATATPAAAVSPTPQTLELTLDAAIAKALAQSPRLKAFSSGVDVARGEYRQSSARQNPEVGIEAENVGGDGAYKGFDSAEVTYGVSQLIEIGGKISAREDIASKGLEIADLDYQAAALDLIRDVTTAYAATVAADENVRLAKEQKELAEDVLQSVSVRVGAAAAPLIQKSRAEVERSTAAIALDTAMRERDIARKDMAALLGEEQLATTLDTTAFFATTTLNLTNVEEKLKTNPDVVKLNSGLEQSRNRLDLEQANAIPDPRVNVGVRDFRDTGDKAFVVGVSLPIPLLNANRGNIAKARGVVSRNELDNQQALLALQADVNRAKERMENAYLQSQTLKTQVMPSATKAFKLSREGYGAGRFPYLEVLDAQRSLFGVKQQHIAALKDYHTARATVERLTALHLGKVENKGEAK